jgi:anti-sigma factor RsiW
MHCHEAQKLFDAYLDGELPPEQTAELAAHRLRCSSCRQALAVLEVTRDVIASDTTPIQLRDEFTDRLLACVAARRRVWPRRLRLGVYYGMPLSAAALIALAFLGVFDQKSKVAGEVNEVRPSVPVSAMVEEVATPAAVAPSEPAPPEAEALEQAVTDWLSQTRSNLDAKRQGGDAVGRKLDLTIIQLLDILDSMQDPGAAPHYPGAEEGRDTSGKPATPAEDVEDL